MEFTKIISSPVFACSAPDIGLKAQSAGDVTLKVSTPEFSWEIVLSTLKNSAGENLVTIRLRDILSSVTAAPSPSETDADAALPLLFVNLAASNSEGEQASTDIPVAYGNLSGKSPVDFIGQWLTSREQVCRTYTWARERLSLIFGPQLLRWSGQVTLKIKCKAYFLSGSPETFELASVSSSENTYYTADCSYARIAALAESESPLVAWDLSYTLTGTDADGESASLESYPQRFLLGRQDERIREFIFVNCFGMEDRVFGEGISKKKVDGSSTTFIAGGQKMEVYNDSETVFEAFSGQLADRRSIFHWHDFLSSATRLLLRPTDASLTRIVIDSHDSETEDFSVGGINFSYRLSDRHSDYPGGLYGSIGDYDPTQQFGALWVDKDPAAVTPEEGDLFFLKHRLSEFPSFNVADELLFLVQSPLTDAWGAFSVGNLKLWIGKFIDNGAKSIRLNALADYETSEGGVIDPAALQNGSIPVWDAAAGAYRPVPASKLGDFIAGKPLYPLIFEKAGKEVDRYTPDVQKTVLDISDVASAKVLSYHISDAAIHVTAAEREAWNLVASLFGVDSDGNVYVKGGKGFYGTSFVSARGSDPEAGTSGGGGLDEDALWDILTSPGTEKIDASHLPAITASMIEGLALASVAYAATSGTAGKVAHALTVKNDGGSSSASTKTFDGSAAVTVTIPTTLPASDVYAWAKAAAKPSYTWSEIGGKPSVFTPAAHTHPLSEISDLHASWDALLKAAPKAYVTRWPAWGEVTGKPSSFTPAEHTHVKADITDFPTSWAWSAITGTPTTLAGYGIKDGVNDVKASGGLSAGVDGHVLTVGVASGYTIPTSAQIGAWNLVASLFGVDSDGNVYVKGGKGFYGTSFVSARGSDPEAGTSGGGGLDEDALWDILGTSGKEKIDISHIPELSLTDVTGLEEALATKLSGITGQMVKDALGYTPYDAAAIGSASVAYAASSGTAGKVAHALTVKNDGGSSSASAKTYNGSAAVTVTIPTTLPASDVYAWAKAATKPSYTWGEIGGKPSVFTPAAHTHPLSDISDLHASWDALLKAAPSAYVTRWPAWGEVTGKPSSFTPAEHTHVKADITDFPTSWAWSAITGKPTTLAGYGITDGVNSVTASGGLSASVSGHKLTVGVASGYAVPTSAQIGAWNLVASLFGVDADGNVYVKGGKGFYGTSFVSARGSDPEAGQGGGTGVDMDAVWDALAAGTSEQINASHIPALNISKITGLQSALDGKLNNGNTTYDTAYAREFRINGTTYTLWAITNPGTIGPLFAPSSPGTNGYILQSTGDVPAWISRSALTQQLFSGYKGCELIPDNSDLNDYTTPGLYFCPANATVQTLANVPVTGAFSLEILQAAGVIQILREYGYSSNANEFTRRYYNGSWTTWVRAPRRNELYTKTEADGRYLKLSGGTVTGNIVFSGATNATSSIKMSTETSNYRVGVQWESTNEGTKLGEIGYWNTQQRIYLNALADEVTDVWTDAVGKYSLVVGKNLLTYNTHPLLHSTNYTHYTVTKTGGGASGTWSINISGNAASATNATNLAGVAGTKYLYHLRRTGYNIDTESTLNPRVLEINNPEGTPPTSNAWLQVLVWGSGDSGYGTQLANRYNVEGSLYFRNKVAGTWKPWRTLIDTSNYTNFTLNRDAIVSTLGVSGTDLVGWTYNGVARSRVTQAQLRTMLGLGSNAYTSTAYLPLTGGTLTGQLNGRGAHFNSQDGGTPFVISRVGLTKEAVSISVNDSITRFDVTNDETTASLLFSLSATDSEAGGGAAAKTGYVNDILNTNTIYTRFGYGGLQRMRVGWTSADGAYLQNDAGGDYLSITDTGDLLFNGGKVWHAGNDGSGSGLDADLLDGTQKSGLLTSVASTAAANLSVTVGGTTKSVADLYATYLDGHPATSFDLSTNLGACQDYGCYVIGLMQITDYTTVGNHANGELILIRQNGNNPTQKIIYSLGTRYNTEDVRFGHLVVGYYSNYAIPCTFTHNGKKWAGFNVTVASSYSTGIVCKRDGLRLGERSTPFLLMYKNSNTGEVLDSEVNGSLVVNGSDITNDGVSTNRFVGPLEGNATSATKLATARTLWGQSFDGTGNVNGHIYLNSLSHRIYFGTSGTNAYISSANEIFSLCRSNNTNHEATLFTINLSDGAVSAKSINATSHVTVGAAGNVSLSATSGVGLMIDFSLRNLSWTVDTSGGWGRSLKATDPTGNTVLMNVAGIYGSAQTPKYVYLGGTSYTNAPFVVTYAGNVGVGTTAPSYKLDVRGTGYFGSLLTAVAGIQIGGTSDLGWYNGSGRLTAGKSRAEGVNVGNLLVSNVWADYTKVPTNGIYSKGAILTDGYLQVGSGRLRWDAANNALYVEKSDGTACGLYSKGYMSARGSDPEAVSGGGAGLDEDAVWDMLAAGTSERINVSHLPSIPNSKLANPSVSVAGVSVALGGSVSAAQIASALTDAGYDLSGGASAKYSTTLTCSTAAATAAKSVACSGFALATGATVRVRFTAGNSASSPTLNVNGTGAKSIRVYRKTSVVTPFANWDAYATLELTYNGTYWIITGNPAVYTLNAQSASDSYGTYYRTARIYADGWKEYVFITGSSGDYRTLAMPYPFNSVNSMGVVASLQGSAPGAACVRSKSASSVTVDFSASTTSDAKRGTVTCFGY